MLALCWTFAEYSQALNFVLNSFSESKTKLGFSSFIEAHDLMDKLTLHFMFVYFFNENQKVFVYEDVLVVKLATFYS